MKKRNHIILGVVILAALIFVALGITAYYISALNSVTISGISITGIEDITLEGLTINGFVEVENPSFIDLKVYSSEARFIYKPTGDVLGIGKVKGGILKSRSKNELGFSQKISIDKVVKASGEYLTGNEPVILIEGGIYISRFKIEIPFSAEYDIGEYIKNYLQENLNIADILDMFK